MLTAPRTAKLSGTSVLLGRGRLSGNLKKKHLSVSIRMIETADEKADLFTWIRGSIDQSVPLSQEEVAQQSRKVLCRYVLWRLVLRKFFLELRNKTMHGSRSIRRYNGSQPVGDCTNSILARNGKYFGGIVEIRWKNQNLIGD